MLKLLESERNPWVSLLLIMLFAVAGLFIFQFLSLALIIPFVDYSLEELGFVITNPMAYPGFRTALVFIQGVTSIGAFVVAPLYYISRFEERNFSAYFNNKGLALFPAMLTAALVLVFMVVNSIFIEWNLNITFPDFMADFGEWARVKEDELQRITEFITSFEDTSYFVLVIFVVAIIPAVGEELLFRGLIQKSFTQITGNVHIAIWTAAILFSAFHMQFFGFVPRLLLGAFFGYLYAFSGNLFYAMLAHFVNNGFTLFMVYLYQQEVTQFDIENTESISWNTVFIFLIIGTVLFIAFRNQFSNRNKPANG